MCAQRKLPQFHKRVVVVLFSKNVNIALMNFDFDFYPITAINSKR